MTTEGSRPRGDERHIVERVMKISNVDTERKDAGRPPAHGRRASDLKVLEA